MLCFSYLQALQKCHTVCMEYDFSMLFHVAAVHLYLNVVHCENIL